MSARALASGATAHTAIARCVFVRPHRRYACCLRTVGSSCAVGSRCELLSVRCVCVCVRTGGHGREGHGRGAGGGWRPQRVVFTGAQVTARFLAVSFTPAPSRVSCRILSHLPLHQLFCGFKRKCETISITFTFASQNSSDLSSGRRPTSKSAEFCDANVIVVEQKRCENTDIAVKRCSYWWCDPV